MFVFEWFYLVIAQAITLLIYYFNRKRVETFELSKLFQSKIHFLTMNIGVIVSCCYLNIQRQLFCIPVTWTLILLCLFCVSFLAFPFVNKHSKLFLVITGFTGLGFFISVYILLFGREEYLIFMAVNLVLISIIMAFAWALKKITKQNYSNVYKAIWFYAAIILTPYLIIFQLILFFKSLCTKTQKIIYISSSIFVLLIGLMLTYQINTILKKINTSQNIELDLRTLNKNPINNYLTELILGAHWKYHTELCNFDGWRPPFHDPVLVISNKVLFPFEHFGSSTNLTSFYDRTLYEALYPNNATAFDCKCAKNEHLFEY
jgi:hypothetical protein